MNKKGYVLIIVISLVAILLIIALSFSGYAYYSLMRGSQTKDSIQMLHLAKAGMQVAIAELKSKSTPGKIEGEIVPKTDPITSEMRLVYTAEWKLADPEQINALGKFGVTPTNIYQIVAKGTVKFKNEDRAIRTIFALVDISKVDNPIIYWEDLGNQIVQQY
ncbi:MAG: hypothetical protein N3A72_05330 [bacterium]|nr:hypothetical protein [bacterium]